MKNKFLAIAAASTAVLGGSLLSAPAQALTASTTTNVNVTVPEVLILKTVANINYTLTSQDIFGSPAGGQITSSPAGIVFVDNNSGTAGFDPVTGAPLAGVNTSTPVATGATAQSKTINAVYAVWSNAAQPGTVNVTPGGNGVLTGPNATATATYTVTSPAANTPFTPAGLVTPAVVGNVGLAVDLTNATVAGAYTGTLNISAATP
jgi:hypothetical protein